VKQIVTEMKKAKKSERYVCRVLSCSRSQVRAKPSERMGSDAILSRDIHAVFKQSSGRYGAPRIHGQLKEGGLRVSRKRVARLMREDGIFARKRRKCIPTTDSKHDLPVACNLLARKFTPATPNRVWAGDITYLRTGSRWSYLSVLIDLYSRRIVGWSLSSSLTTEGPLRALNSATSERQPKPGLLVHHDRGCQYASSVYREQLERSQAILSMSRKGNCWDNAPSESFFATLKKELGSLFISFEAAQAALETYIDWYNTNRRHSFNRGASPIQKEVAKHIQMVA
jgi:putative transposase